MKRLIILFLFIVSTSTAFTQIKAENESPKQLEKILSDLTGIFNEVQVHGDFSGNVDVEVNFETALSKTVGGGFQILIFKFGRKRNKVESSSITYNFVLERKPNNAFNKDYKFKLKMANAINEAMQNYSLARKKMGDLKPKSAAVKVAFTLEETSDGSGEFTISPITINASKSVAKKSIHYVKLTFNG